MCGIAGIFYLKNTTTETFTDHANVLKHLRHRGPDYQQHKAYGNCHLYHSRLVILDLSASSNQPFEDSDNTHALVFNGEIFNYRDLNSTSIQSPKGDVEVLFDFLKRNGTSSLSELNGFFAFAFLDRKKNKLSLVRDRFGVKPLFYYQDEEKLVFASELKTLLCITGPMPVNDEQVYSYFRLNYSSGKETIYKNVYRLPPGSFLEIEAGKCTIKNWYHLPEQDSTKSLAELLEDAVKLRLHADVPVGSFLSGGLDSSIVSALAKKHKSDLNTFSIGFKNHDFLDESKEAEKVASHLGTQHSTFRLSEDDFLQELPSFLEAMDEPFADSSGFNFFVLSKLSRQKVKVALSGDGADELFKGYQKHKALFLTAYQPVKAATALLARLTKTLPSSRENRFQNTVRKINKLQQIGGLDSVSQQALLASISSDEECRRLIRKQINGNAFSELFGKSDRFTGLELEDRFDMDVVLPDDMLVKADRFSMHHALEIRNPFLDHRVVHLALRSHARSKISFSDQKILLKKTFAPLLPRSTVTRRKKGFELPLRSWLCGQLYSKLEQNWLNETRIRDEGWFRYEYIRGLMDQLRSSNPGDSAAKIWAIVVFQSWLNTSKDFIKPYAKGTPHHQSI